MNLPNKLTLGRIILTPFYLAAMVIDFDYHFLIAAAIFIVASVTDFLDGSIARKRNLVTTFGKLCDPLADKMLVTAALLSFMKIGVCNIWIVMIILAREFLVTSFRLVATSQGIVIPAGIMGKIKTVCQMIFSIIIMIALHFAGSGLFEFADVSLVSNVLLSITAVLAVISGAKYILDGKKVIDFSM